MDHERLRVIKVNIINTSVAISTYQSCFVINCDIPPNKKTLRYTRLVLYVSSWIRTLIEFMVLISVGEGVFQIDFFREGKQRTDL